MNRNLNRRRFLQLAASGAGVAALAADAPAVFGAPAKEQPAAPLAQATAANKRGMRLEKGFVSVTKIQFGAKTALAGGVLTVNKDELTAYLMQDQRLGKVELDLANPGDSTRIVRTIYEFEPRVRTGSRKGQFPWPGVLGAGTDAGDGSLTVLDNTVVMVVNPSNLDNQPQLVPIAPDNAGATTQMNSDAGGLFSKFHNLVVMAWPPRFYDYVPKVIEGAITTRERDDFYAALAVAGMRAAAYLGNVAVDMKPEKTEVYELPPLSAAGKGMETLPKIAFIFDYNSSNKTWSSPSFGINTSVPQIYGEDGNFALPVVMHPNEVLDGAVMALSGDGSYGYNNLPYIKELYARHGKDICFVGVVATTNRTEPWQDKHSVTIAARQVAQLMGADGCLVLKHGGGAPQDQVAALCKELMNLGVKAVGDPQSGGSIIPTNPEPQWGIVNTGGQGAVKQPAVEKVIGFDPSVTKDMKGEMNLTGLDPFRALGNAFGISVPEYEPADDPVKGPAPSKTVKTDKNTAQRAIDMVLAMIAGKEWKPEIVCTTYEPIKASPGIKDPSKAKIAIISGTGLVRRDDETRFTARGAVDGRFSAYSIAGVDWLSPAIWEVNHGGYREDWARADPERLIPMSTWKQLEKEGKIGKVNDTMYCFSSLGNTYIGMMKVAEGLIPRLKADKVDAAVISAT